MTFWQLTVNALDPPAQVAFWSVALGYGPTPPAEPDTTWNRHYVRRLGGDDAYTDRIFDPEGRRPPVWFQRTDDPKDVPNRIHVDVYVTGRDDTLTPAERTARVEAHVARLVGLGGEVLRRERYGEHVSFVVMRDPEGNEFCVS